MVDPPVDVEPPVVVEPPVGVEPPVVLDPPVEVEPPVGVVPPVVVDPPNNNEMYLSLYGSSNFHIIAKTVWQRRGKATYQNIYSTPEGS